DEHGDPPPRGPGQLADQGQQASPFEQDLAIAEVERLLQPGAVPDCRQKLGRKAGSPYGHRLRVLVVTARAPASRAPRISAAWVMKPPTRRGAVTRERSWCTASA